MNEETVQPVPEEKEIPTGGAAAWAFVGFLFVVVACVLAAGAVLA